MIKYHFQSEIITGFAAAEGSPGQEIPVCTKMPLITSDEPFYYVLMTQITNVFLNKIVFPVDSMSRFLLVIHNDQSANIYINDFSEISKVKLHIPSVAGQKVFSKDISDIESIYFPEIEIKHDDSVIYWRKIGWKFGLYFNFTRSILMPELFKELGNLHKELHFQREISVLDLEILDLVTKAHVVTEGKTDWKHLKRALMKLNIRLPIKFHENQEEGGDQARFAMCLQLSKIPQKSKIIFIFDQDNEQIVNELNKKTVPGQEFQAWGNNVYSFYIPKPSHRQSYKNICIEFYYTDDEIHTADIITGKKLLFSNEISEIRTKNPTTNEIELKVLKLNNPRLPEEFEKKIYSINVDLIIDEENNPAAHSKEVFAKNILEGRQPFDQFNFNEFRKIFEVIAKILDLE